MHPPLVPRKMPVVSSRAHNCSYQIGLVASGQVKPLAAYLPSGNGTSVVVVSNIRPKQKKQPAKGRGLFSPNPPAGRGAGGCDKYRGSAAVGVQRGDAS